MRRNSVLSRVVRERFLVFSATLYTVLVIVLERGSFTADVVVSYLCVKIWDGWAGR